MGCLLEVGWHEGRGATRTGSAVVLFVSDLWIEPSLVVLVLFGSRECPPTRPLSLDYWDYEPGLEARNRGSTVKGQN